MIAVLLELLKSSPRISLLSALAYSVLSTCSGCRRFVLSIGLRMLPRRRIEVGFISIGQERVSCSRVEKSKIMLVPDQVEHSASALYLPSFGLQLPP